MPTHRISFEVSNPKVIELPAHRLRNGGRYSVEARDGDLYVFGNKEGLLYLSDLLAMLALGDYEKGFHVHIPAQGSLAAGETGDEIVMFGAEIE